MGSKGPVIKSFIASLRPRHYTIAGSYSFREREFNTQMEPVLLKGRVEELYGFLESSFHSNLDSRVILQKGRLIPVQCA